MTDEYMYSNIDLRSCFVVITSVTQHVSHHMSVIDPLYRFEVELEVPRDCDTSSYPSRHTLSFLQ